MSVKYKRMLAADWQAWRANAKYHAKYNPDTCKGCLFDMSDDKKSCGALFARCEPCSFYQTAKEFKERDAECIERLKNIYGGYYLQYYRGVRHE